MDAVEPARPDFYQRFEGNFHDDRTVIDARWEAQRRSELDDGLQRTSLASTTLLLLRRWPLFCDLFAP